MRPPHPEDARASLWRRRSLLIGTAIALLLIVGLATWGVITHHNTRRLSEDTRIVVRISSRLLDRMTADTVDEEFPFQEEVNGAVFDGVAKATGTVRVAVTGRREEPAFVINVKGRTFGEINGIKSPVQMLGEGRGTFDAAQQISFDGRNFHAGELHVSATHETTITAIEPLPGTPLGGAVRLIASRTARQALPELDRIAAGVIENRVRDRVTEMVRETIGQLRHINRIDETIAILHPDREWRVRLFSGRDYLQAALVPAGGAVPELPELPAASARLEPGIDVWVKMTRTERGLARVAHEWRLSHRLLRRYVEAEKARSIARSLQLHRSGSWMRFAVGAPATEDPGPQAAERVPDIS